MSEACDQLTCAVPCFCLIRHWFLCDLHICQSLDGDWSLRVFCRQTKYGMTSLWLAGSFGLLSSTPQSDEEGSGTSSESSEAVQFPGESMLPQWNWRQHAHVAIYLHASLAGSLDLSLAAMETNPRPLWGYAEQLVELQMRFSAGCLCVQVRGF
jgi:hypothetical protein